MKHSHCCKQENAIVPSRKWNRNTGGPQTMDWCSFLHCESVGQAKAHGCRVKIGEIIFWFTQPPCSSEPRCGLYWQWPIWRREETWIHPEFLICFQNSFIHPPTLAYLPLIAHAIDWNPKRRDQDERNPAFLWIVDWMWWRCGVLFL